MNATRIDRGSTDTTTIYSDGGTWCSSARSTRRASRSGRPSPIPSSSRAGGASTARRRPSSRWTSGRAASGATSAARPIATTWSSTASTSRSTPPTGYKWTFMFDVEGVGPMGGPETHILEEVDGKTKITSIGHMGLGRGARGRPGDRHGRRRDRDLGPPRGPAGRGLTPPTRAGHPLSVGARLSRVDGRMISGMRVAVTGGSGKLGRAVVADLLDHDYEVLNLDIQSPRDPARRLHSRRLHRLRSDPRGVDAHRRPPRRHRCDRPPGRDPRPGMVPNNAIFANNVISTYNVFSAARDAGIRNIVWASSETVLGLPFDMPPPYLPADEDIPFDPRRPTRWARSSRRRWRASSAAGTPSSR